MLKILIATNNPHKARELKAILPKKTAAGQAVRYFTLKNFPQIKEPKETGQTLQENALIKAKAGLKSGLITLADDTGLMVDALGGAPGVKSARYACKTKADYNANNIKLLKELAAIPPAKRTAAFVTIAAMAWPEGKTIVKEGKLKGRIATAYSGRNGFGYDPLFLAGRARKTMAGLTAKQKNKISHRAKAFAQIAKIIEKL
ncbi:MAG: RdgB/HAM1 family non-canonical purine NTP pyrophosphatase [Elusimicrobiota bacterium]|nr:RdgB/HAM1 family non-canonical purine NTP pyrophosphatase [Elusimicrobiota bacterium]